MIVFDVNGTIFNRILNVAYISFIIGNRMIIGILGDRIWRYLDNIYNSLERMFDSSLC